jgi:hypothetical protein
VLEPGRAAVRPPRVSSPVSPTVLQLVAIVQLHWPTLRAVDLTGGAEDWAETLMRVTGAELFEEALH